MDAQLDSRLQAILDAAESAAVNAGAEVDTLPIRNEIEEAEDRLAGLMNGLIDTVLDRLISNREAIGRLQTKVDQLTETVESIQSELPE